jgi:ribose 5-phosphate isomerase B
MKLAVGADHRGSDATARLVMHLESLGHEVETMNDLQAPCLDYPDSANAVGKAVASGQAERGVLICGTGIGMCMAANKVKGIRAALVHDELSAELSRRHNDANVLCLSADLVGAKLIERIVQIWLTSPFEGGRHARRVNKIMAIEAGEDLSTITE